MKKLLASVLALAMALSLGTAAWAEDPVVLVDITMDNWFVYFDLVEEPDPDGDESRMICSLRLKDEYFQDREAVFASGSATGAGQEVAFQVAYDEMMGPCDESGAFLYHPLPEPRTTQVRYIYDLAEDPLLDGMFVIESTHDGQALKIANAQVISAQGKLPLTRETAALGTAAEAAATPLPSPTPRPASEAVEITLDNWSDYFEIAENRVEEYNAFDELTHVQLGYFIALRDPLISLVDMEQEGKVAFMFTYDRYKTGYDGETGQVTRERALAGSGETDCAIQSTDVYGGFRPFSKAIDYGQVVVDSQFAPHDAATLENFAVTRVQGTIYLVGGAQAAADALAAAGQEPASAAAPTEVPTPTDTPAPTETPAPTDTPAEEVPAEPEGPAGLLGAWDEENYVYTNETFGLTCALDYGWYYYYLESLAEQQGWEESGGVTAEEYLTQILADGHAASIMFAGNDETGCVIQLTLMDLDRGYDTSAEATTSMMMAQTVSLLAAGKVPSEGTLTIGGQEYTTMHVEVMDESEVASYEEHLCLVNNDMADHSYMLVITMRAPTMEDMADVAGLLTIPAEG